MQTVESPAEAPATVPASPRRRLAAGDVASRFGVLIAWALVIVVFSILEPHDFPTSGNFETIFGSQSVLLILTIGLIVPLTTGEFDLSISGVLSVSLVLVGYLNVVHHWPVGLAALVAVGAGLLVGAVNAFFVVVIGVESLIATLGMGTLLTGVGLGINHVTVAPISQSLVDAMGTRVLGLQAAFFYGLGLTILCWYVFSHTPLGRYLHFVGAGREVARLAGLRVDALRSGALIASAMIAALAGVVLAGLNGSADPNVGSSFLLPAFAAAFLGSTVFMPGRFNPWGSFVAVYFLVTGITGLELKGLASWIEPVFYGGSLVIAVAASRLLGRRAIDA
jgi:ribose transport system permease protein